MSSPTKGRSGTLEPEILLEQLNLRFPRPVHYWVGFSGGLDSSVLLNLLVSLRNRLGAPLSAVHVDHALQTGSCEWAAHCERECARLQVPLQSLLVDATPRPGESPEAAAREARYRAIAEITGPRAMLLTAHHLDDQAETLLLQLLRGAGVEGLAAMPAIREWGQGWHARPLLGMKRRTIREWAVANGLHWVDDPSNTAVAADRNYLRHAVMPDLLSRWPGAVESIARSASHCADAADVIRAQAEKDIEVVANGGRPEIASLKGLSAARARNVLRYWLRAQQAPPLSSRRLRDALDQLCNARSDASVRIAWNGVELRRFRGQVWLLPKQPQVVAMRTIDWTGAEMHLGPGLGLVRRKQVLGGVAPDLWERGRVQLGYQNGALRYRPAGRRGSRSFKKLAQEFGIPPWLRAITPVLLIDGRPAAVANCCACEPFAAGKGKSGWLIEWIPD